MKNLHLMPMNSTFDDDFIVEMNNNFLLDENLFVLSQEREIVNNQKNVIVAPNRFTSEYINNHYQEFRHIVLHSLFLSEDQIIQLSDEAARKIVWCVWGHDLYQVKKRSPKSGSMVIHESVHFAKKVLRGTYLKMWFKHQALSSKISKFHCVGIDFPPDAMMVHKRFGHKVNVRFGTYFSKFTADNIAKLRQIRLNRNDKTTNILIGHSGFDFIEHEKYLNLLSKYKDEDVHIFMVLCYGASKEKISCLKHLAHSIFGEDKCTIYTEMMPKAEYYQMLTQIDIGIFPFKHQSALANTKGLAYMGAKMYFDPKGVLSLGFREGGVHVYDCNAIGKVSFSELISNTNDVDVNAPLFRTFRYFENIDAWKSILS